MAIEVQSYQRLNPTRWWKSQPSNVTVVAVQFGGVWLESRLSRDPSARIKVIQFNRDKSAMAVNASLLQERTA